MYIERGREIRDVHWREEEIPEIHWRGEEILDVHCREEEIPNVHWKGKGDTGCTLEGGGDTGCKLEGGGHGKLGYFIVNFWVFNLLKYINLLHNFRKRIREETMTVHYFVAVSFRGVRVRI